MSTPSKFRRQWLVPLVLGILSLAGLLSALIGDGLLDGVSWITLAAPLGVIGWHWRGR